MVVGFDEGLVDGTIFGLDFVILEMMVLIWVLKFGGVVIFCIIVILFIFCLVIIWLFCWVIVFWEVDFILVVVVVLFLMFFVFCLIIFFLLILLLEFDFLFCFFIVVELLIFGVFFWNIGVFFWSIFNFFGGGIFFWIILVFFFIVFGGFMNEFIGKADFLLLLLEVLFAFFNIKGEEEEGILEFVEDLKVFIIFWWFWFRRFDIMFLVLSGRL